VVPPATLGLSALPGVGESSLTINDVSRSRRPSVNVRRARLLASALTISATALTSCGNDSSSAPDDATVLEVDLGRFVIEPAVLEAPAGFLVLRVTNRDPELAHDLVVHGKGTLRLAPGDSQTVEIPEVVAGEYPMWCDVPGHAEAGQTGTLVVSPALESPEVSS
jgi:uncharacterized cupredoxin-like copper-binding protein